MKKNILKVAIIAAFGLFAGYTVYSSQKEEAALSEILLDNVEALASESGGDNWYLLNVTQTSHSCLSGGYFSCL